jgi:hypothetical protein
MASSVRIGVAADAMQDAGEAAHPNGDGTDILPIN